MRHDLALLVYSPLAASQSVVEHIILLNFKIEKLKLKCVLMRL